MTESEVRVRPLSEVSETAVLELLDTCLGAAAAPRSPELWRWKHRTGPFGPSPGLVAMAGGRPVAVRVFLRWRWRFAGHTLDAVRAVDTATHPDWRRRGLFRHLTGELVRQCRDDGVAFVFNTPNPTSRAGYLSLGWQDVGRAPLMVRPLRPWRVPLALLSGRGDRAELPEPPGRTMDALLAAPSLPSFLAAWGDPEHLHTPRSPDYLRWRYGTTPGLRYRATWHLDGSSGALLVTRRRLRRGLSELSLSELLVSDDDIGRRRGVELLGRIAASSRVDYLAALAAPGTVERSVLATAGYRPVPLGPRLTVLPLAPPPPDPCRSRVWRPAVGDLELF